MESAEVAAVNALAQEIAKLTRIREEEQAIVLKEHGALLNSISTQVSLLVERTNGLADLTERVTALELWQSRSIGFGAAILLIGGVLGWMLNLYFLHG